MAVTAGAAPGGFGGAAVEVRGLKELIAAFRKFDKDLASDLTDEVIEAANPVKMVTQKKVGEMSGIAARETDYWSAMRIGVSSRSGNVYIVPAWRSNKGTKQGGVLKREIMRRMEEAVDEKGDEVEKRLGDFLDTLADDWGSQLAA